MGQRSYTAAYHSDAVKLAKELGALGPMSIFWTKKVELLSVLSNDMTHWEQMDIMRSINIWYIEFRSLWSRSPQGSDSKDF